MARPKKQKQFEIDFKFPNRDRDLMFKDDGTDRYTVAEMLDYAALQTTNDYVQNFVKSLRDCHAKAGTITDNQKWHLYGMAAVYSPAYDEMNTNFFAWYDSRPDMQALYVECAPKMWWHYDREGHHHNVDVAREKGWLARPETWKMFQNVAYSGEGNKYRELNREVVYDVGDQVVLRRPFKGSYRYDPTYGVANIPFADDRVGMVMEHKENISRRSRGGKGSRLINVLWLQTGQQKEVPERTIKKYKAPKE